MTSTRQEIGLVEDELAGLSELARKGLVPKTRIMALQRQAAGLRGDHGRLRADRTRPRPS